MSSGTVTLNVTGTKFKVSVETFEKLKSLSEESRAMLEDVLPDTKGQVFVERHPGCFEALLHLCVHGELHMPPSVCPQIFKNEMHRWGVKLRRLENCCYNTMVTALENRAAVEEFEADNRGDDSIHFGEKVSGWRAARNRMWCVLEMPGSSRWAMVYFCLVVLFTLISLFTVIASTHSAFFRSLDDEEEKELLGDKFTTNNHFQSTQTSSTQMSSETTTGTSSQTKATTVITSTSSNCTSQVDTASESEELAPIDLLYYLDYVTLAFFTLDFCMRLALCPTARSLRLNVFTALDLVALLAIYCNLMIDELLPEERYTISLLDSIECLQIFRIVRIFRLLGDLMGFKVLFHTIKASIYEMLLLVLFLSSGVLLFGFLAFWSDRPAMKSIPDACWWAIVTMTTVGYGDMYPTTFLGKVVGSLCAVSGVVVIAVTVPILVNNFLLFYSYSKLVSAREKEGQVQDEKNLTRTLPVRVVVGSTNKVQPSPSGADARGRPKSSQDGRSCHL